MMEFFFENSGQLLTTEYFSQKSSIIDIWQSPKYASVCKLLQSNAFDNRVNKAPNGLA